MKSIRDSPYNKNAPIRTIDAISLVTDYTKGGKITGKYCGQCVIAMLAGVTLDEVIELMKDIGSSKQALKKALDYYGIQYAPKSTHILKSTANVPNSLLPDVCVLRVIIADKNGEFKFKKDRGHWCLFFKGRYYDPDGGVSGECPKHLKIFQVWQIYP
ncbi:MAG: hypothetical protein LBT88_02175 [Oscillospiraceae bacterium]|jgi:hypothetical protein|nr:hypothetical protein [Oscillospiraceae bacterium]